MENLKQNFKNIIRKQWWHCPYPQGVRDVLHTARQIWLECDCSYLDGLTVWCSPGMQKTRVSLPFEVQNYFGFTVTFGTQCNLRAWNTWRHALSLEQWMWKRLLWCFSGMMCARNVRDRDSIPLWGTDFFGPTFTGICYIPKKKKIKIPNNRPIQSFVSHLKRFSE